MKPSVHEEGLKNKGKQGGGREQGLGTRSSPCSMSSGPHDSNTSISVNVVVLAFAAVIAFAFSNVIMMEWV